MEIEIIAGQFYPWAILVILIVSIITGYGRTMMADGGESGNENAVKA